MAFTKKIKAESPDRYLKSAVRKGEDGQAQLARLAHVNALQEEVEAGLQQCTTQVESSDASALGTLPNSLQKTGSRLEYSDGVVLEGWKLSIYGLMDGTADNLGVIVPVTIPTVPGEANEGYYLPFNITGIVKATDDTLGEVVSAFQHGAELRNEGTGATVQCDFLGIVENTTGAVVDFELRALANGGALSSAEIFCQIEFLCYEGVIPTL